MTPNFPAPPPVPHIASGRAPNILMVLFDDVGFSDFGCYGSSISTPTIDKLAATGLRYTGFHTTAMCSTTRAALLTGRNHHSVGMGCLANFDSGYPGYRGKISKEAGTLAEMLRPHGYRNYMVGKWHVTPLTETGATGPYDGWPLGRGFDRFYGFMDAETDQYAPELVRDNTPIAPPGTYESGYHLTEDLVTQTIGTLASHIGDKPELPWFTLLALGACHAPHQAPQELIKHYDTQFAHGWDVERERRLAQQIASGIVPPNTTLPPRNDGVKPWAMCSDEEKRLYTRLQAAYAAMLDHADQHLARLLAFLETTGQRDNTLVVVLSDNGASQEGGPMGMVNAMGPYNFKPEPMPEKLQRLDDIGGPDTHSNFPWGWAMAANTPLKRYKQNTHGGGIRDPLVISWPQGIAARGEVRTPFCHVSDVVPTVLDLLQLQAPTHVNGVAQMPLEGESFKASLTALDAPARKAAQYFEMFGHRGLWQDGWKAVAPGTPFDADKWELYHLSEDFAETHDRAADSPDRLQAMQAEWQRQAQAHQVLPLDDRFGPRFADNARRYHGPRSSFTFHRGMGHVPADVAPDVRARHYTIEADVRLGAQDQGVLIAHGDATSGYSLYVQDGKLKHDINIGGLHQVAESTVPLPEGDCTLGVRVEHGPLVDITLPIGMVVKAPASRQVTLLVNGQAAGQLTCRAGFNTFISWSGLDIGLDRGSPVSHYAAPFEFTGLLRKVTVKLDKPVMPQNTDAAKTAEQAAKVAVGRE
jgi:arylsulfatase A-like enzyme